MARIVKTGATLTIDGGDCFAVGAASWVPVGLWWSLTWPDHEFHTHVTECTRAEWARDYGFNLYEGDRLVATLWPFDPGEAEKCDFAHWREWIASEEGAGCRAMFADRIALLQNDT